ncbi:unnamed protein product [Notodromas monacha]|uniref:Selenoprotein F n=1 Tax=Notodromas monacha TaxID=399045 RepID=A0A7R9BWV8_9CRUS|nr:unnamed protein product [Notodromas monacha]CAG0921703.1 unnamed protein product [Notodromas monacha]
MYSGTLAAFAAATLAVIDFALAELSVEECRELGLNRANLMCTSCDQLSSFDLEPLLESCKQCCQKDTSSTSVKRYARASLQVSFVKSDRPEKFPGLTVQYKRGQDPVVKLMNAVGEVQETLAIDKWTTDTLEEFLLEYLDSDPSIIHFDHSSNEL